jgi:hypothetical protein
MDIKSHPIMPNSLANFAYTEKDMDKSFSKVIGGLKLDMRQFRLNMVEYETIEKIYCDILDNDLPINAEMVQSYGFLDVVSFHDRCVRGHLWNSYQYSTDTLREFLDFYHSKVQRFHPSEVIPRPPERGNILSYLKSFKPEWLLSVGW